MIIKRLEHLLAFIGVVLLLSALILGLSRCSTFAYDKSTDQCSIDCHGKYYYLFGKCKCEKQK